MNKTISFFALVLFLLSVCPSYPAGSFSKTGHRAYVDSFDFQTAQYFYAVHNDIDDENEVVNICLYDIRNNTVKYVFPPDNREVIEEFYYQIGYKTDENRMLLFPRDTVSPNRSQPLSLDTQKASRNLIVVTYSKASKLRALWICGKNGEGLKKLAEFDDKTRLEIDSMFNKILLIRPDRNCLKIHPYDY